MSNKSKITNAYQNVERQALGEADDPHFVVLMMFDALLKSMALFHENIAAKEGSTLNLRSDSFARALTIIYALQSSLDFEKGGVYLGKSFSALRIFAPTASWSTCEMVRRGYKSVYWNTNRYS